MQDFEDLCICRSIKCLALRARVLNQQLRITRGTPGISSLHVRVLEAVSAVLNVANG